jgi:hypothetical protein
MDLSFTCKNFEDAVRTNKQESVSKEGIVAAQPAANVVN